MDVQSALELLGLDVDATAEDIYAALASKKHEIAQKRDRAPTDALKEKFTAQEQRHSEAAQWLLASLSEPSSAKKTSAHSQPASESFRSEGSSRSSRLSETKLADLPGMSPQDASQVELQPGQLLANRYEVKELIGQGGMGAVYRAYDQNRSEDIAIKVLLPSLTKNERALERFLNEARVSSKLSHPKIVNVYDVQNDGDLYFLTMELLEGQDLRQVMDNQKAVGRPFDITDVKEYIAAICEALASAHETTVHRDIKPENIWIGSDGKIKLMDFGIAQLQSSSQRTQTGAAMGTAYYMAPEQLKGLADIDGRADQYAVAVLAYELLTGEVPAGAIEPIGELRKDIPKGMANAIMQALSPRAENRFADIAAFDAAIQTGKGGRQARRRATGMVNGGGVTGKMNPAVITFVAALIVMLPLLYMSGALDALKPVDRELLAQQENEANTLIGEIKVLRSRMTGELADLESADKDSERKGVASNDYNRVWWQLADQYIGKSDKVVQMEGLMSAGENRLRRAEKNEEMEQALTSLRDAKAVQVLLSDQLAAIPDYLDNVITARESAEKYAKHAKKYSVEIAPGLLENANVMIGIGNMALEQNGDFITAAEKYRQAGDLWLQAIDDTADQVEKMNAKWEAERVAREKAARESALKDKRIAALKSFPESFSETDYNYGLDSKDVYKGDLSYLSSITNKGECELQIITKGSRKHYLKESETYTREGTTSCRSGDTRIDWEPIRRGQYFNSPASAECRRDYYEHESTNNINNTMTVLVAPNNSVSMRKNDDWVSLTASFCTSGICKKETNSIYWESSDYTNVKKGLEMYASACGASFSGQ